MSFAKLFANVRRYNDNATVIFDREEPIGRATDLVMPRRRWFRRRKQRKNSQFARGDDAIIVGQALPPARAQRWLALQPDHSARAADVHS